MLTELFYKMAVVDTFLWIQWRKEKTWRLFFDLLFTLLFQLDLDRKQPIRSQLLLMVSYMWVYACTCGGSAGLEIGKAILGASGVLGFWAVLPRGGVTLGRSCASMTSNAAGGHKVKSDILNIYQNLHLTWIIFLNIVSTYPFQPVQSRSLSLGRYWSDQGVVGWGRGAQSAEKGCRATAGYQLTGLAPLVLSGRPKRFVHSVTALCCLQPPDATSCDTQTQICDQL